MTAPKVAPKVGDRVRVTVEGEVSYANFDSFDIGLGAVIYPNRAGSDSISVEILPPPVRVGDVATREVLDALPTGSIIHTRHGGVGVAQNYAGERRWRFMHGAAYTTATTAEFSNAEVIYIPDPR